MCNTCRKELINILYNMMFMVMILMTLLIMNPGIRSTMGGIADPILSPILPEESFFIMTVLILGTFSMLMNTVLRSFFLDPIEQAHIGHRQGQIRRMMNDARISRDPILQEKATILQQQKYISHVQCFIHLHILHKNIRLNILNTKL